MRPPGTLRRPLLAAALACGLALTAAAGRAGDETRPAQAPAQEDPGAAGAPGAGPDEIPPGSAQAPDVDVPGTGTDPGAVPRTGLDIYRAFREGLAEPECEPGASERWRQHFAHVPRQLAAPDGEVLALFGYVVDMLRAAHLPTEYALIPFVESGYRPGARSPAGPAGLWQFIATTARNHNVPVTDGYDGRLSPVDSTVAAVRYLKTLHGMFAGDWRLAVMAFNTGEYRVLGALRRSGQPPAGADHGKLALPPITRAYVRKLHALSCIFEEAEDREAWLRQLDRPVPVLAAMAVPGDITSLDAFARAHGLDPALLRRLNPAHAGGRIGRHGRSVLAPADAAPATQAARAAAAADGFPGGETGPGTDRPPATARSHTVARGDTAWTIARRYGVPVRELLARNGLDARAMLRPGMVLRIDGDAGEAVPRAMAE